MAERFWKLKRTGKKIFLEIRFFTFEGCSFTTCIMVCLTYSGSVSRPEGQGYSLSLWDQRWGKERRWFKETANFNTALLLNKNLINVVRIFKQRIINRIYINNCCNPAFLWPKGLLYRQLGQELWHSLRLQQSRDWR